MRCSLQLTPRNALARPQSVSDVFSVGTVGAVAAGTDKGAEDRLGAEVWLHMQLEVEEAQEGLDHTLEVVREDLFGSRFVVLQEAEVPGREVENPNEIPSLQSQLLTPRLVMVLWISQQMYHEGSS